MFVSLSYVFFPLALVVAYRRNIILIIPFILLAYIFGFLREYGADYNSYIGLIEDARMSYQIRYFSDDIEIQWRLLFRFLTLIFSNEAILALIFILSLILRIVAFRSYFQNKDYVLLALAFFFITDFIARDLGQIRNAVGASLLCISFMLYCKRGYPWYVFLLPLLGHVSYASVLVVIFIYEKFNPRLRYFFMISGFVLSYFVLKYLSTQLTGVGGAGLYFKLIAYSSGYKHYQNVYPITLPIAMVALIASFCLRHRSDIFKLYIWIFTIAICSFFVFKQFPIISSRVYSVFTPLLAFALCDALSYGVKTTQIRSILYFFMIAGAIVVYAIRIYNFHILHG